MTNLEKQRKEAMDNMSLADAREYLATKCGEIGSTSHKICSELLEARSDSERDNREIETLSIARKALTVSRSARNIAISAIVLSIIMAMFTIMP